MERSNRNRRPLQWISFIYILLYLIIYQFLPDDVRTAMDRTPVMVLSLCPVLLCQLILDIQYYRQLPPFARQATEC